MYGEMKMPTSTLIPRANQLDPTFFRISALENVFMQSADLDPTAGSVAQSLRPPRPPRIRDRHSGSPVANGVLRRHPGGWRPTGRDRPQKRRTVRGDERGLRHAL